MPDIQGVILIDVWSDTRFHAFYKTVLDKLRAYGIQCCVNASYNLDISGVSLRHNQHKDRSMHNTFRMHLWNRPVEKQSLDLDTLHPSDRLVYNVMRFSRSNYRCDSMLATPDLLASDASLVILDPDDFLHHCKIYHNDNIKNWLVVGQAWNMCVHFRPMGLYNLRDLAVSNGFNFFVANWSVLDQHGHYINDACFDGSDHLIWESIDGFGHRLAG